MIASFLLFLQFISSLFRKCSPRGIQLSEKGGKEVAARRGWSYPANHPWWFTLLQKDESHSCPFAEYEHAPCYYFKNRSAPPSDNWGVSGRSGCWKLRQCPNLAYRTPLKQSLFMLVSSGKCCTNGKKIEDPVICLGLLSEQQAPCHQWCLFVTKLLSPFQTTDTPKYLMNQGEKNRGYS